ncbi:hypothetical protein Gpo141_00013758, partial [Globisporangium polare]
LRVRAAVDDGCREKLLIAQRVYRKSDPKFFQELNLAGSSDSVVDDGLGGNEATYEAGLGYDEDGDFDMHESWVAVDYPMSSSSET